MATLLDPDATVSSVVREAGIRPSCRGQSRARPSLSFAPARIVPDAEHGRRGRPSGADGIIAALRGVHVWITTAHTDMCRGLLQIISFPVIF